MKHLGIAILSYLALVLQTGWGERLAIQEMAPEFLLLMLVFVIFCTDGWQTIIWAMVLGGLRDAISVGPLGIDLFSCVFVTSIVGRLLVGRSVGEQNQLSKWNTVPLSQFVFTAFLSIGGILLFSTALRVLLSEETADAKLLLFLPAAKAAYSASLGFVVLFFQRFVCQIIFRKNKRQSL